MTDSKKNDQKADQATADQATADQAKADQKAENARQDQAATDRSEEEAQPLTEAQAPTNPIASDTLQADYDPTGQIQQPGQPLHSTDPQIQAEFEEERREAIRRSQMGERLPEEEQKNEGGRTRRERKTS